MSGYPGPKHDRMSYEIYSFCDHLLEYLNKEVTLEKSDFDRIIFCGMGGSAIGGDMVVDCVRGSAKYPMDVLRFPELPKWVNKKTLAIVTSHSGNTKETLSMYDQARAIGCRIIIITSGGKLMEIGQKNGDVVLTLDRMFQPRSSLGSILGIMSNVVDALCGTRSAEEMREALPHLFKLRDELSVPNGEAERIADFIGKRIPIIYTTSGIYASAIRWKGQINENAKVLAFSGSVPEFNHNEIYGWASGKLRERCAPVFLFEAGASADIVELAEKSIDALKSCGQDVRVVQIQGKTALERAMVSTLIGDYVSLYLAYMMNVDPQRVDTINDFKRRLGSIDAERISGSKSL